MTRIPSSPIRRAGEITRPSLVIVTKQDPAQNDPHACGSICRESVCGPEAERLCPFDPELRRLADAFAFGLESDQDVDALRKAGVV